MMFRTFLDTVFFIIQVFFVAFFYITISIFIANGDLLQNVIFESFSLESKIALIRGAYGGVFLYWPFLELILLLTISLLTGINLALVVRQIRLLLSSGKLRLMLGGNAIAVLATTGCVSCGVPLIAFLGLGSSFVFLPLNGYEFSLVTLFLLVISFIIIIRNMEIAARCKLPSRKRHAS